MKYKTLLQTDEMSCGVTCLAMICEFYGIKNISMAIIRKFAGTDQNGNNIASLKIAAEKLHMESKAVACNREAMLSDKVNYPLIVHTLVDGLYPHYMVVFEANDKKLVIGDPAVGLVEMAWEEFEQIWTKKIILLKPTENFDENKKYKRNYKVIINLFKQFKTDIVIIMVLTGIASGIAAVVGQFYSYLIDKILPNSNFDLLVKMVLAFAAIVFATFEINIWQKKVYIKFNRKMDRELILKMYNRIVNLPMSFFATRTTGDVLARYSAADELRQVFTSFSIDVLMDIAMAIWALFMLLTTNWQMFVVALFMQELLLLIQVKYTKKIEDLTRKSMHSSEAVESFANQTFSATETIKSYVSEKEVEKSMEQKYKQYQKDYYSNEMAQKMQENFSSTIQNIGNISMLAVLGIFVMSGSITVGQLVKCYMFYSYIFAPLEFLMSTKGQITQISATLERLEDILNVETEEELDKKKIPLKEHIESINFEHVSFRYGMRPLTLKDIHFQINKGDSVGIIGSSGCGKTTLIKLILDFFDVTDGAIYVNGTDMRNLTSHSVRKKMAYVSQNDYWFQDTIFNNLTIGDRNTTTEKLDEICSKVKMTDYIKRSDYGYNTMIEEEGGNLSSGERQRFSIAKALVVEPDVLILDESTSNLDAKTEEFVVEQLNADKNKIKIIVAHRLNTLLHCNKIIAIDDGEIVESGTAQELLKKKGMFYNLWKIQGRAFEQISSGEELSEEDEVTVDE